AAEVGLAWRDAVHDEDFEAVNQIWSSAIEKGTAASAEFRVKAKCSQSEVRWLEISAQQRHDKDGNLEYLYVWLRDISTSKQLAEQRLQDALETKRRSEIFIDMVSHEMRNPLGAILLLADSIVTSLPPVSNDAQASVLTPGVRQTLADIAASIHLCANHQKVIVEEILTFSRLDSNLLVLAPEKVRPSETVQTVLKMVKAELDYDKIQGSLQIQQSYIDLAIDNVVLDPGRLSQIILNLMTNAIKFTKNSSERRIVISLAASKTRPTASDCQVTLVAPREDKRPKLARRMSITNDPIGENVYLIFSVRDTGCGLTPTEMGHLFHRFSQASPKTYKQYGGSGLGLFISRELVELQGGQIGVRSQPGEGSTFAFFVETARIESPPEPPSAQLAQTSIKDHMRVVDGPAAQKTQVPDLHVLREYNNPSR
ncbi:histidine kinase, partial [Aureobasidium melanogenum]